MNISITDEQNIVLTEEYTTIIENVINEAVDFVGCEYECEVDVTLVDNNAIHEINLAERGIDNPTDVLSFPMLDFETPGELNLCRKSHRTGEGIRAQSEKGNRISRRTQYASSFRLRPYG